MWEMKKNEEKIKTGWPIPVSVKESFVNFCAKVGCLAQEDCAGALLIWQYLPAQIREKARLEAKNARLMDEDFWQQFSSGLELGIKAQLNIQKKKPEKKK
jgi:hypothetical protein